MLISKHTTSIDIKMDKINIPSSTDIIVFSFDWQSGGVFDDGIGSLSVEYFSLKNNKPINAEYDKWEVYNIFDKNDKLKEFSVIDNEIIKYLNKTYSNLKYKLLYTNYDTGFYYYYYDIRNPIKKNIIQPPARNFTLDLIN